MTPMRRHLTAVGVWIPGRADRGKQLLERCHSQLETKRAIAIVGIKPIVACLQDHAGGDEYGFMSGAAYLKEYFVLALEWYFLVVEPAREIHRAIHLEHLSGGRPQFGRIRLFATLAFLFWRRLRRANLRSNRLRHGVSYKPSYGLRWCFRCSRHRSRSVRLSLSVLLRSRRTALGDFSLRLSY